MKWNLMVESLQIKEINVKSILSKSNLPVCEYSVNPYVGCTHACKYCYASFMKRFTGHTEDWGTFLDIKYWKEIKNPGKYKDKELFIGSVTGPYNPQEKNRRARHQCNLIWLENLNLRGGYKTVIMDYIREKYPQLYPLYHEIYDCKDLSFWINLDKECKAFAAEIGLDYVTNDDSKHKDFNAPPVIVNYFYHEQIIKSTRKVAVRPGDACSAAAGAKRRGESHAGIAGS